MPPYSPLRASESFTPQFYIDISNMEKFSPVRHCFQDILDEADTDKNGLIDYKEFFNLMSPGRA